MLSVTRNLGIALALLAMASAPAWAVDVVINNGAANLLSDATHAGDVVYLRNVGCPPAWPAGAADDACPSPGAATEAEAVAGASVQGIEVLDSSSYSMNGGSTGPVALRGTATATLLAGTIAGSLSASDQSTASLLGGSLSGDLVSNDQSSITLSGGTVGGTIIASDLISSIFVIGTGFQVNGMPVPFGPIPMPSGTLTGVLASGDPLSNSFSHFFGLHSGTILLIEAGPANVPALGLLAQLGLVSSLVGLGLRARPQG
jgi:hypothetical protein